MCIYIYTYVHIYIYTYVYIYLYFVYTYVFICIYIYIYTYTYVSIETYQLTLHPPLQGASATALSPGPRGRQCALGLVAARQARGPGGLLGTPQVPFKGVLQRECIYIYIHTCRYIHIYIYMYMHIYTYICRYINMCMYRRLQKVGTWM